MKQLLQGVWARALLSAHRAGSRLTNPSVRRFAVRLSYLFVARDVRVWTQVQAGAGEGLWLKVSPRTGAPFRSGLVEPETQAVLQEHLRPGDVFYDLGANIGVFSLIAARMIGPEGRVVALEPDPDVARQLRENVERNGFRTVTVREACAWRSSGAISFSRANPDRTLDRGLGSAMRTNGGDDVITVRAYSLDDLVKELPIPTFIKCDVEGAEVEVMAGATTTLAKHRPVLFIEIHDKSYVQPLREILRTAGYEDVSLTDDLHLLAVPPPATSSS